MSAWGVQHQLDRGVESYTTPAHSPYSNNPSLSSYPPPFHSQSSQQPVRGGGQRSPYMPNAPFGVGGDVRGKPKYSSHISPNSSLPPSPALSSSSSTSTEQEVQSSLNIGSSSSTVYSGTSSYGMIPSMAIPPPQQQMGHPGHMGNNMGQQGYNHSPYGNPYGNPIQPSMQYNSMKPPQQPSISSNRSTPFTTPHQTPSHTPHHSPPPSASSSLSGQTRANADQLKTFLRKKACLYEVDTSRSISIVTWLVGRILSCRKGHFTRQELQTNIHNIVSPQIDSNQITRTKVNRCMQIILNSCFHYVIPKPDGFDEASAKKFAKDFADSSVEDSHLLDDLPAPWKGLKQRFETVKVVYDGNYADMDNADSNTVLLCFNDNIRSAADVLYSHNEFIRDIAMSNNLKMTPEDWKFFYRGGTSSAAQHDVMTSPHNFEESFIISPNKVGDEECGRISNGNLAKFRTSWCEKRYTHESKCCAFAHSAHNHGWLRRNPTLFDYKPVLCEKVKYDPNLQAFVNKCELGTKCPCSHSYEEIHYHPKFYKSQICNNCSARDDLLEDTSCTHAPMLRCRGMSMDICPFIHYEGYTGEAVATGEAGAQDLSRDLFCTKASGGVIPMSHPILRTNSGGGASAFSFSLAAGGANNSNNGGHDGATTGTGDEEPLGPKISPMLYVGGAPTSEFENVIRLPGLISLFRQNSSCLLKWSREVDKRKEEEEQRKEFIEC